MYLYKFFFMIYFPLPDSYPETNVGPATGPPVLGQPAPQRRGVHTAGLHYPLHPTHTGPPAPLRRAVCPRPLTNQQKIAFVVSVRPLLLCCLSVSLPPCAPHTTFLFGSYKFYPYVFFSPSFEIPTNFVCLTSHIFPPWYQFISFHPRCPHLCYTNLFYT